MEIYCEDLVNRYNEISQEEVEDSIKNNDDVHKMVAALISLKKLNNEELDLDDWECQLGSLIGFGVIDSI